MASKGMKKLFDSSAAERTGVGCVRQEAGGEKDRADGYAVDSDAG